MDNGRSTYKQRTDQVTTAHEDDEINFGYHSSSALQQATDNVAANGLSVDEVKRIGEDQQRVNAGQIGLHSCEVKLSGRPLVEMTVKPDWRLRLTRCGKSFMGDEKRIALARQHAPELAERLRYADLAPRAQRARTCHPLAKSRCGLCRADSSDPRCVGYILRVNA